MVNEDSMKWGMEDEYIDAAERLDGKNIEEIVRLRRCVRS
jgi:hypothetical protein